MWYQKTLTLSAKSRGFHLVTDEILNQLADMPRVNIGLLHLLLQHTSASLTLNENCDPTVRHDMERFSSAPFPTTEIMSMTMREQTICLLISNPQCWEHRLYCRCIKGVFRPAPARHLAGGTSHPRRIASHHRDTSRGVKNDHFELLQYCMAKPGAEQSVHNDWKATQIKVEDVLFAMVKEVENRPAVSLKTSPELAELLRQQHSDVRQAAI